MTKEEIFEGNKLIVEFMEVDKKISSAGYIHSWSDPPFYYTTENSKEKVIHNIIKYSKYHSSYDWLMPVLKKINLEYNTTIGIIADENIQYCEIVSNIHNDLLQITWKESRIDEIPLIELVYSAVIEFIKWRNNDD